MPRPYRSAAVVVVLVLGLLGYRYLLVTAKAQEAKKVEFEATVTGVTDGDTVVALREPDHD
jgi:hypothetical protein